jgi:predicted nuclease with TOPRIM domain
VVAARIREVAGEEIAKAEARVRAAVDSIVEERVAPVRARIAEVRAEGEARVEEARARLADERQQLQARLDELTRGLGGVLPLPRGE